MPRFEGGGWGGYQLVPFRGYQQFPVYMRFCLLVSNLVITAGSTKAVCLQLVITAGLNSSAGIKLYVSFNTTYTHIIRHN